MFVYTISDIIDVVVLLIIVSVFIVFSVNRLVKQYLCKHENYYETMSCDAVCYKCGKNLGFIGNIRDRK